MLIWRNQWLRPAQDSVDTKQRLCFQGYLTVNKCHQEESNPLLPECSGLGYFVSAAGSMAGAAQAGEIQKPLPRLISAATYHLVNAALCSAHV